jgi:hypothetical protein
MADWSPAAAPTPSAGVVNMADWSPVASTTASGPSLWDKATSNAVPGGGGLTDPLGAIARAGGRLNARAQKDVDADAEAFGRAHPDSPALTAINDANGAMVSALSKTFIPQNRASVALNLLAPAYRGAKWLAGNASEVPDIFKNALGLTREAPTGTPFEFSGPAPVDPKAELNRVTELVSRAKNQGVTPSTILTEAEKKVYASSQNPIDQAAGFKAMAPYHPSHLELPGPEPEVAAAAEPVKVPGVSNYQYKDPTKMEQLAANALSTQSAANPKHIAAVIANPEYIMGDATPTKAALSQAYQDTFKNAGVKFDSATMKEITGKVLPPTGTQLSKFEKIIEDAHTTLQETGKINPAQAFMARSAAGKLMLSSADPARNKILGTIQDSMDNALSDSGLPQIKQLGQQWFRASAKEAMQQILPLNKNMSPNAVRGLLMANYGGSALSHLANAEPIKAAVSLGKGAIMSPAVQGGLIRGVAAIPGAVTNPASVDAALKGSAAVGNIAGNDQTASTPNSAPQTSPALIASLLKSNTLNPQKSGQWGKEISGIGLPSSMVSGSGKASISQLARLLNDAGAIPDNDEGAAVQYLKSIAGKVK